MTLEQAKNYTQKLLKHYPFTYCPTLASYTSNRTPHKGDVVLFYRNGSYAHTGYVYNVDSTYFYTIEGNTSGASGVIANGGGVCKKSYRTSSYTSSKFFRPDYSILVKDKIFSSVDEAINTIISVAKSEVGYLEKKSNSNLDSKTANAGSNNYTKYWRDIKPSFQTSPWCACFVTWIIQYAILNKKASTTPTQPVSPTPSPTVPNNKITVDGSWGVATTKKAQQVFKTIQDGIISNQPSSSKKYLSGADTSSWKFKSSNYSSGSQLIKAIQKKIGTTADGLFGKNSVIALQKFLGVKADGYMGSQTVKAWQNWLNKQ